MRIDQLGEDSEVMVGRCDMRGDGGLLVRYELLERSETEVTLFKPPTTVEEDHDLRNRRTNPSSSILSEAAAFVDTGCALRLKTPLAKP